MATEYTREHNNYSTSREKSDVVHYTAPDRSATVSSITYTDSVENPNTSYAVKSKNVKVEFLKTNGDRVTALLDKAGITYTHSHDYNGAHTYITVEAKGAEDFAKVATALSQHHDLGKGQNLYAAIDPHAAAKMINTEIDEGTILPEHGGIKVSTTEISDGRNILHNIEVDGPNKFEINENSQLSSGGQKEFTTLISADHLPTSVKTALDNAGIKSSPVTRTRDIIIAKTPDGKIYRDVSTERLEQLRAENGDAPGGQPYGSKVIVSKEPQRLQAIKVEAPANQVTAALAKASILPKATAAEVEISWQTHNVPAASGKPPMQKQQVQQQQSQYIPTAAEIAMQPKPAQQPPQADNKPLARFPSMTTEQLIEVQRAQQAALHNQIAGTLTPDPAPVAPKLPSASNLELAPEIPQAESKPLARFSSMTTEQLRPVEEARKATNRAQSTGLAAPNYELGPIAPKLPEAPKTPLTSRALGATVNAGMLAQSLITGATDKDMSGVQTAANIGTGVLGASGLVADIAGKPVLSNNLGVGGGIFGAGTSVLGIKDSIMRQDLLGVTTNTGNLGTSLGFARAAQLSNMALQSEAAGDLALAGTLSTRAAMISTVASRVALPLAAVNLGMQIHAYYEGKDAYDQTQKYDDEVRAYHTSPAIIPAQYSDIGGLPTRPKLQDYKNLFSLNVKLDGNLEKSANAGDLPALQASIYANADPAQYEKYKAQRDEASNSLSGMWGSGGAISSWVGYKDRLENDVQTAEQAMAFNLTAQSAQKEFSGDFGENKTIRGYVDRMKEYQALQAKGYDAQLAQVQKISDIYHDTAKRDTTREMVSGMGLLGDKNPEQIAQRNYFENTVAKDFEKNKTELAECIKKQETLKTAAETTGYRAKSARNPEGTFISYSEEKMAEAKKALADNTQHIEELQTSIGAVKGYYASKTIEKNIRAETEAVTAMSDADRTKYFAKNAEFIKDAKLTGRSEVEWVGLSTSMDQLKQKQTALAINNQPALELTKQTAKTPPLDKAKENIENVSKEVLDAVSKVGAKLADKGAAVEHPKEQTQQQYVQTTQEKTQQRETQKSQIT